MLSSGAEDRTSLVHKLRQGGRRLLFTMNDQVALPKQSWQTFLGGNAHGVAHDISRLKLIVPGYFGTYWVKHLSEIEVIDHEFSGHDAFLMTTAYLRSSLVSSALTLTFSDPGLLIET